MTERAYFVMYSESRNCVAVCSHFSPGHGVLSVFWSVRSSENVLFNYASKK